MKRLSLAIAALLVVSAVSLVFLVVPAVTADTFPGATPQKAVPALWITAAMLTAVGVSQLCMFGFARQPRATGGTVPALSLMACLVFVVALLLLDGAAAYWGHGRQMHATSMAMFATAAICGLDGLLTIVVVYASRKTRPRPAEDLHAPIQG